MKKVWILAIAALMAIPLMSGAVIATNPAQDMDHHRDNHGIMGEFQYENGTVQGRYVSFYIDPNTGEIRDYSVNNVSVFTSINYKNSESGNIKVSGAKFTYIEFPVHGSKDMHNLSFSSEWKIIQSMDVPVGILHMVTHGRDVITYDLSSGINATQYNSTVILSGKISGELYVGNGNVSVENNEIIVETGVNMHNVSRMPFEKREVTTSVLFVEHRNWNGSEEMRNQIRKAFENREIGGEMYIGHTGAQFINYTDGMHAKVMLREKNHIRIEFSGDNIKGGRIVIINIENDTLNYHGNRVMVKLDGKSIKETSIQNVMSGGAEPKYAVERTNTSMSLVVYLPHFSEHTLDVESEPSENPVVTNTLENPLLVGVGILLIIGIVVLIGWRIKSR